MTEQTQPSPVTPEMPPAARMMGIAMGAFPAQSIYVAAKLGLADLLAGGAKTPQELASATETDAPSLYRVMRALASLGVFAETPEGTFVNTPMSETMLSDSPTSLRAMMLFMGDQAHWRVFNDLLYSVQTGKTAWDHVHGEPCFDYMFKTNPEFGEIFNKAMTSNSHPQIAAVLEAYDFSGIGTLADIAGGHGHMLGAILQKYPSMKGILFEHATVLDGAPAMLAKYGAADRVELVEGDFFSEIPVTADAYIMKHIIHDWDDEKAGTILTNIHHAMPDDARVLIVDCVIPPGNDFHPGKMLDLEMLIAPGGLERSEAQFKTLLANAGFELKRIIPTQAPVSIVEAKKA